MCPHLGGAPPTRVFRVSTLRESRVGYRAVCASIWEALHPLSKTWGGGPCGPMDVVWVSGKTLSIRLRHPGKSRGGPCGSVRAYGRAGKAASPQPRFRLGSLFVSLIYISYSQTRLFL
jgi:hypothetical protein